MESSLKEENKKIRLLLESLTPGGSEFYNDPEYCAKFVKDHVLSVPKIILKLKQQNKILIEGMERIKGVYDNEADFAGKIAKETLKAIYQ